MEKIYVNYKLAWYFSEDPEFLYLMEKIYINYKLA